MRFADECGMDSMERARYGKERRVKRVRISSTVYLSGQENEEEECSGAAPGSSPCKDTVNGSLVLPLAERPQVFEPQAFFKVQQVEKLKNLARKKKLLWKDEREKVGNELVVWTETPAPTYSLTLCEECGKGDAAEEMLLCDKCDRGFHMFCLSPILVTVPPGDWICPHCSQSTTAHEFQMVQKKIVDYFSAQSFSSSKPGLEDLEEMELKKQRGRPSTGARLLPFVPTADFQRRLEQMASLAAALTSLGVDFSDSLSYAFAPRTANRAAHEKGGMRVLLRKHYASQIHGYPPASTEMPKEDKETVQRCKTMCRRGEWQPLMVTYDLRQGFVVEADEDIKSMTFIAEYTGEVDYMCCRHYDPGNSIMGLLFSDDPVKELVICPDRKGNVARFLSGINNHTEEGRSKQNVRCVRYSINGEARVILIAMRDILKGERLYYDYNAYYTEYPTQHFV